MICLKTSKIRLLLIQKDATAGQDRKSTRLNSSHVKISYAASFSLFPYTTLFRSLRVFFLKDSLHFLKNNFMAMEVTDVIKSNAITQNSNFSTGIFEKNDMSKNE